MEERNSDNGFELVDRPREVETLPSSGGPLFFTGTPLNLPQPILLPVAPIPQAVVPPSSNAPVLATIAAVPPIQPMAPPAPLFFPAAPSSAAESLVKPSSFQLPIVDALAAAPVPSSIPDMSYNSPQESKPTSGLFGWMGGIPGKGILSRVAEKARNSVDTLVTTLDPQMKEFLHSGGDIDIVVASSKESKVGAVREAFQTVFGKATVRSLDAQSVSTAAQPVGFVAAQQAAAERITQLRSGGQLHPQLPVVAVEGFVVELFPNNWFEMGYLLLDDPARNARLEAFTQPLPVPASVVTRMRDATSPAYPARQSGFALTVGQAMEQEFQVPGSDWHSIFCGISRRESILLAAKTLAFSYKKALGPRG